MREALDILMESIPKGMEFDKIKEKMLAQSSEIISIHDLHVWQITSHMNAMTAHIVVPDMSVSQSSKIRENLTFLLESEFTISHCTFQFEPKQHINTSEE